MYQQMPAARVAAPPRCTTSGCWPPCSNAATTHDCCATALPNTMSSRPLHPGLLRHRAAPHPDACTIAAPTRDCCTTVLPNTTGSRPSVPRVAAPPHCTTPRYLYQCHQCHRIPPSSLHHTSSRQGGREGVANENKREGSEVILTFYADKHRDI